MSGTSAGAKKRWANATKEQRRMMGRRTADDPKEFFRRVNKNGPTMSHMKTPCWLWTGSKRRGYGRFTINGKFFNAHVYAFEMRHGPLKSGELVLHRCDNPSCVRDGHLFKGSYRDNAIDAFNKGRRKGASLPGSSNPMAKLTEVQVAQLRLKPLAREHKSLVANALGVSIRTINKILQGTRWRGPRTKK